MYTLFQEKKEEKVDMLYFRFECTRFLLLLFRYVRLRRVFFLFFNDLFFRRLGSDSDDKNC